MSERVLVATADDVLVVDPAQGTVEHARGLGGAAPTGLAADPHVVGRAWCCTHRRGVFTSDDGGTTWAPARASADEGVVRARKRL